MSEIKVTTWGHSAVRFERAGRRLLIDPGVFSDATVLPSADAVLITHEHPDHFAAEPLLAVLGADAAVEIWAPAPVVTQLAEAGAPGDRLHEAVPGTGFTAAGFAVRAVGGQHAVIHPDIPRVANVGYLVEEKALHPGDSFVDPPAATPLSLLLLPISAPWLKVAEAVEYLRRVAPSTAVPIHDSLLSDAGRGLHDRVIRQLAQSTEYRRLAPGETLSLS